MGNVSVHRLGKKYKRYANRWFRLLELITKGHYQNHEDRWALRGITFKINSGDALGIVGQNGAGNIDDHTGKLIQQIEDDIINAVFGFGSNFVSKKGQQAVGDAAGDGGEEQNHQRVKNPLDHGNIGVNQESMVCLF